MNDHRTTSLATLPRPVARTPITVRVATLDDVPFIDTLQKMHSHMVGFFPKKQMESYIEGKHVLIAEGDQDDKVTRCPREVGDKVNGPSQHPDFTPSPCHPLTRSSAPLGYIIYKDQYLKRDDVGIVYQLNVQPMQQRNLIGATLLAEAFERSAYGCKLFCCWCAQDIRANWFWEACGFVPLAFRTGSRGKQRIHIFWQKRIRQGDTDTPWWYPYQTSAGSVREDRLVLPVPPDYHWRDEMPLVLPSEPALPPGDPGVEDDGSAKLLPGGAAVRPRVAAEEEHLGEARPKQSRAQRMAVVRSKSRHLQGCPPGKAAVMTSSGIKYVDRGDAEEALLLAEVEAAAAKKKKRARKPRRPRAKHDPEHVQQARELRDRYIEQLQREPGLLLEAQQAMRYDVSRQLEGESVRIIEDVRLLEG